MARPLGGLGLIMEQYGRKNAGEVFIVQCLYVWQSSLTVDELRRLESMQKRATMIKSVANDYEFYCFLYVYELDKVRTRLNILTRKL